MEGVETCMGRLVEAIEDSTVYTEYKAHRERVLQCPEIRQKVNEYRRRNYALQHMENIDLFYELEALEKEYREFLQEEMVQRYLESELSVCRLMQKVIRELSGAIDLDLDEVML